MKGKKQRSEALREAEAANAAGADLKAEAMTEEIARAELIRLKPTERLREVSKNQRSEERRRRDERSVYTAEEARYEADGAFKRSVEKPAE